MEKRKWQLPGSGRINCRLSEMSGLRDPLRRQRTSPEEKQGSEQPRDFSRKEVAVGHAGEPVEARQESSSGGAAGRRFFGRQWPVRERGGNRSGGRTFAAPSPSGMRRPAFLDLQKDFEYAARKHLRSNVSTSPISAPVNVFSVLVYSFLGSLHALKQHEGEPTALDLHSPSEP